MPAPQSKEDLTQLLVARFHQMLGEGVLKPGAKLPSERELAAHFKVARSSLRPALKVLELMGVIQQKIGDGSYLNQDASAVLALPIQFMFLLDQTSIRELSELRSLMEPDLAAKAAERATASDVGLLRQSIRDLEESKDDRVKLLTADLLFHRVIFEASGNRFIGRVFYTIHRAMLNMMMVASQLVDIEHTAGFHRPICEAIERRESALASKLMAAHVADAAKLLERAYQLQQERAPTARENRALASQYPGIGDLEVMKSGARHRRQGQQRGVNRAKSPLPHPEKKDDLVEACD